MPPVDDVAAAEAADAAAAKEYGHYVAKEPIFIGGARAFNAGDPVPKSHVERGVVSKDAVVGANTKAAQAATTEG